jgi:hypothetical protein
MLRFDFGNNALHVARVGSDLPRYPYGREDQASR